MTQTALYPETFCMIKEQHHYIK